MGAVLNKMDIEMTIYTKIVTSDATIRGIERLSSINLMLTNNSDNAVANEIAIDVEKSIPRKYKIIKEE